MMETWKKMKIQEKQEGNLEKEIWKSENVNGRKWDLENENGEVTCVIFFSHKDLFRYIIASMAGYPSTAKPNTWSLAHGSNATQDFLGFYQATSSPSQSIFQMLNTGRFILQLHAVELDLMLQDLVNFGTELCLQSFEPLRHQAFPKSCGLWVPLKCVDQLFFWIAFKSYSGNFSKWIK